MTLFFIVIATLLALSNPDLVVLSFWPFGIEVSVAVWLVILASFGLGLLVGALAMLPSLLLRRFSVRRAPAPISETNVSETNVSETKKTALPTK